MEGSESRTAGSGQQVAHARPLVERCLTWSGLVPLPAFLLLHLCRELSQAFAGDVSDVLRRAPGAFEQLTSVLLVWLPLGLHVGAAALLVVRGRLPRGTTRDVPAMARAVSRVAAALALVFVVYHAETFTWPVWLGRAAAADAGFRLIDELSGTSSGVPLRGGLYLLGLLATVTHAALGVHRGLLLEGVLTTHERRRRSARACAAAGALAFWLGAAAVIRVATGVLLR